MCKNRRRTGADRRTAPGKAGRIIDKLSDLITMLEALLREEGDDLFTGMDVEGEDEKSEKIPDRSATAAPPSGMRSEPPFASQKPKPFPEQEKKVKRAPYVPYRTYRPDVSNMTRDQRDYYRYWRSKALQGSYEDTDLSYIYVYVYEILNGMHWYRPEDGYRLLVNVWQAYRKQYSSFNQNLCSWAFDFTQVNGLDFNPPEDIPASCFSTLARDVMIEGHRSEHPLKLPVSLLASLSTYRYTSSKFCMVKAQEQQLEQAIPRVVALTDAALIKSGRKAFLKTYGPVRSSKQIMYLYRGTPCTYAGQRFTIWVRSYTTYRPLVDTVSNLIRFTENVLREICGFRGRLKVEGLDPELCSLIERFLKDEYGPKKAESPAAPTGSRKVSLDFEKIGVLREESDTVREELAVPEEAGGNTPALTGEKEDAQKEEEEGTSAGARAQEDSPDQGGARHPESQDGMQASGEEPESAADAGQPDAADPAPNAGPETASPACKTQGSSAWPEGLVRCVEALDGTQREALRLIAVSSDAVGELARLAEESMTMPELLIDEINEAAESEMDDILVDAGGEVPQILEEYAQDVREILE